MDRQQQWQPVLLEEDGEITSHREPGEEFLFYRSVAAGLIDAVQENCSRGAFENMEGVGRLSDNPVTNLRYHFVVTAAMLTRFCMEGGMPMEEAFRLSDEYIRQRKIDMAKNLLRFSNYDFVEIAVMLSYSSQSHFIQHFRSQAGMTPKAYRKQNYLNNWNVNREPADVT